MKRKLAINMEILTEKLDNMRGAVMMGKIVYFMFVNTPSTNPKHINVRPPNM